MLRRSQACTPGSPLHLAGVQAAWSSAAVQEVGSTSSGDNLLFYLAGNRRPLSTAAALGRVCLWLGRRSFWAHLPLRRLSLVFQGCVRTGYIWKDIRVPAPQGFLSLLISTLSLLRDPLLLWQPWAVEFPSKIHTHTFITWLNSNLTRAF